MSRERYDAITCSLVLHPVCHCPACCTQVLEKTYHMLPEDDGVLERAEGTKIEWNAGERGKHCDTVVLHKRAAAVLRIPAAYPA